eukprot:1701793-Rhodomonas_salina.2
MQSVLGESVMGLVSQNGSLRRNGSLRGEQSGGTGGLGSNTGGNVGVCVEMGLQKWGFAKMGVWAPGRRGS